MIRLLHTKVYISVFALILICILPFSYDAIYLYIAIFSAFLHEAGHLFFMKHYQVEISKISIYPFGVDIRTESKSIGYPQEAIISISGTMVSLILFLVAMLLFRFYPEPLLFAFMLSNFMFFIVNFLPVKGLDGGNTLLSLLLMKYDFTKAYRIFSNVSTTAFALLCFFSFYLIYLTRYNLSLLFICLYLFISEYTRQKLV